MRLYSKPRLLVVTTSYPINQQSAFAYHIRGYLSGLGSDFDIVVITPDADRHPGVQPVFGQDDPGRIIRFRYAPVNLQFIANKPGGLPAAMARRPCNILLATLLWSGMVLTLLRHMPQADVVHANWSLNGLVSALVGKIFRVPVITTLRGSDVRWAARSALGRLILSGCARWNQCLVTVSPGLQKQVAGLLGKRRPGRLLSIENGVDRELFAIDPLVLGPSCTELRILVVSNLIYTKRVDLAIIAFAGLEAEFNARLEIIGLGSEFENLRSLAQKLGVLPRVVFRGAVPHNKVVASLAACQILVHPSLAEGRSNVVLEAMAAGRAVTASRIPGIDDLIEDGVSGLLFDAGDQKQLTSNLRRLAEDSDLKARLGNAARKAVQAKIDTWENTSKRYAALFRQELSKFAGKK